MRTKRGVSALCAQLAVEMARKADRASMAPYRAERLWYEERYRMLAEMRRVRRVGFKYREAVA